MLDPLLDPKCLWALRHPEHFPVEVSRADREMLLRVPGMGVTSVARILKARRVSRLRCDDLKTLGVVMKRAQFFITCRGRTLEGLSLRQEYVMRSLMSADTAKQLEMPEQEQLSLFNREEYTKCLTGQI